ncbi:MAG: BON domain-containing protein [Hyphomonadaceae bacterium]
MRSAPSLLVLVALSAAPFLNGCVSLGAAAGASMGALTGQDRTFGESYEDNRAANSVKAALNRIDRRAYAHVGVNAADGRLLMFGTVPTEEHRQTAELVARSARGVDEVYDEIRVGPAERAMRSAGDELLATQIHTRLIASPNVRGVDIDVEAFQGVVYLMGAQRTEEEVRRAAEIASTTAGVTRVISLMSVRDVRARLMTAGAAAQPVPQAQSYPENSAPRVSASAY